jgi:hypothetical protein
MYIYLGSSRSVLLGRTVTDQDQLDVSGVNNYIFFSDMLNLGVYAGHTKIDLFPSCQSYLNEHHHRHHECLVCRRVYRSHGHANRQTSPDVSSTGYRPSPA